MRIERGKAFCKKINSKIHKYNKDFRISKVDIKKNRVFRNENFLKMEF